MDARRKGCGCRNNLHLPEFPLALGLCLESGCFSNYHICYTFAGDTLLNTRIKAENPVRSKDQKFIITNSQPTVSNEAACYLIKMKTAHDAAMLISQLNYCTQCIRCMSIFCCWWLSFVCLLFCVVSICTDNNKQRIVSTKSCNSNFRYSSLCRDSFTQ